MAHKLGFKNYAELSYLLMYRTDYNAEMVQAFRDQVRDSIVPVVIGLRERQHKQVGGTCGASARCMCCRRSRACRGSPLCS